MFDVVIIGSGMAGISLASELSEERSVCILEKEKVISYHSTGRSMAFYIESYGIQTAPALAQIAANEILNKNNFMFKKKYEINLDLINVKRLG